MPTPGQRDGLVATCTAWCRLIPRIDSPIRQPSRSAGPRAELRAKPAYVDINRSGFDEALVTPDPLEQAIPRQHTVAVVDEKPKQLEFTSRQANRLAVHGDGHGVEIRAQMFALVDGAPRPAGA